MSDFEIVDSVLKKYIGSDSEVTIPDTVTSIGEFAFAKSGSLNSLIIPNTVTSI